MTHAIIIHEQGGPEVMKWEEVADVAPGPGQVRIRHKAVGLNYIDCYHRSGLYPLETPARSTARFSFPGRTVGRSRSPHRTPAGGRSDSRARNSELEQAGVGERAYLMADLGVDG